MFMYTGIASGDAGNDGADRMAVWGAFGKDMGEDTNGMEKSTLRRRQHIVELKRRGSRDVEEQVRLDRQSWLGGDTTETRRA